MASPYRADHVGSLLRPPELIQARTDHAEGRISAEQLHEAEDAAVLKALALQKDAGISIFTDGEYRRPAWSAAIRQAVDGLVPDTVQPTVRLLGAWQGPSSDLANAALASPAGAQPMVVGP
jgi:5-methyltetrahydropteroyltriglutamate--homocysteine methyltransferase